MSLSIKICRILNELYNFYYVKSRNIPDYLPVTVEEMANCSTAKCFSTKYMMAWVLNIKRLIAKSGIPVNQYHFLDVGCGKGVPTLYAGDMFQFQSASGLDFELPFIEAAKANHASSTVRSKCIHFFVADAAEIVLEQKNYFIFMFNPFSAHVMRRFLDNNIESFRKTNSVIGYVNAIEIDVFCEYHPLSIENIPNYNSAVIKF